LVVTHPFHPLRGQRLAVLFERRYADGRLYVCEGGPAGTIGVPEDATDRAPAPASTPLTAEVLAGLVELVAAIGGPDGRSSGRCREPVLETDTSS
jgi:Family of unknown function (DUF5372)